MSEPMADWEAERKKIIAQRDRINAHFSCVFNWLELLEDGADLQPYFKDHKCSNIAIYGVAELGEMLLKEIKRGGVTKAAYFLDRNAARQREKCGIPVYLPEEFKDLPDGDMIVVTAIISFEAIEITLLKIRPEIPVVSINTIIDVRKDEVWYDQR